MWLHGGRSYYTGRQERLDPSPRCCSGMDCLRLDGHRRRHAVVTMLRSDNYLGVAQVACKCLSLTRCDGAEQMQSVCESAHRINAVEIRSAFPSYKIL